MLRHCRRLNLARIRPVVLSRLLSNSPPIHKRITNANAEELFAELPPPLPPLELRQVATGSIVLDTVREYTKKYPLCVLLIQVGDFYELYESHATHYAAQLDLKLTKKDMASGVTVDFAGFPLRSLDRYLDMLVNKLGCRVALCEQHGTATRDDGSIMGKRRRITRIITPGTVIEERFLDATSSNYLLAVLPSVSAVGQDGQDGQDGDEVGLAWIDLSVGEFVLQQSQLQAFKDDVARIRPREVILPTWMKPRTGIDNHPIVHILSQDPSVALTYQSDSTFDSQKGQEFLKEIISTDPTDTTSTCFEKEEEADVSSGPDVAAAMALLHYVDSTHMGERPRLQRPVRFSPEAMLRIDSAAMGSLEIVRSLKDGRRADSLLGTIDCTITSAGSRLLTSWLTSPLTSMGRINTRLDIVEFFESEPHILNGIRRTLHLSTDAQRALQRLAVRRGQRSDLVEISSTFEAIRALQNQMSLVFDVKPLGKHASAVKRLFQTLDPHQDLVEFIQSAVNPIWIPEKEREREFGYVNRNFNPELKKIHKRLDELESNRDKISSELKAICGNSVTLVSQGPYKHIVELNASQAEKLTTIYACTLVNKTKSKHRYQTDFWTPLSVQIETNQNLLVEMERKVFEQVVQRILDQSSTVLDSCRTMAQLDVLTSFAWLSREKRYVRPNLSLANQTSIVEGRHPVVEAHLARKGREFVRNDLYLGQDQSVWLLTGPNMGGKSTFLRQNAVIVLLAHIGCFVPAKRADIGITDRIFSRVGASDNLAQDQSTFMVEMVETATILQQATARSMVIMDEVGRGTSTTDGFSLAYAILYDLCSRIGCRTLFATHYHELAKELDVKENSAFDKIKCFMTSLHESEDGSFTFLHHVRPGVCTQSHGLKVAQLAGLPPSVVHMAQGMWTRLNQTGSMRPKPYSIGTQQEESK
ncbi:DNA mismatch repair protein MutS [Phycomyces nitens]|nr:DNA mismatch repair protein MutS [Phycomyces nitens]